jgi:hypothetical protein
MSINIYISYKFIYHLFFVMLVILSKYCYLRSYNSPPQMILIFLYYFYVQSAPLLCILYSKQINIIIIIIIILCISLREGVTSGRGVRSLSAARYGSMANTTRMSAVLMFSPMEPYRPLYLDQIRVADLRANK